MYILFKELNYIILGIRQILERIEKKEKKTLFLVTLLMIFVWFLINLPAIILWNFVDKIISIDNPTFSIAIPFIISMIVIILLKESLTILRKYLVENIATQTEKKQTINIINHVLKTDISEYINKYQVWALNWRISRSVGWFIKLIKLLFLDFFPVFFTWISAVVIILFKQPTLAWIMLLLIPTALYIVFKQISSQKWIRISLLREKEKIDWKIVEMIWGIETIRTYNTTDYEIKKIDNISENLRKIEIKHHIWMAIYDWIKYLNESFFYILVVSISIYLAVNWIISKWDILTYSILFSSIILPFREIHRILDETHESIIKLNDLIEIYNQPIDKSFVNTNLPKNLNPDLILDIKSLYFSFWEKDILKNINFSIKKWEKIWIVWASGCGKSTLVKIILKIVHNYKWNIDFLWDNLFNLSREIIAQKVAYIPQSPFIFSWTIRENLTYWVSWSILEKDMIKALKLVNLYDEIEYNFWWLNWIISESWKNLSWWQKQRLAISRAILKNPEVIVFDEATSALDNTNEKLIQENIEKVCNNCTMVVIAHRLSTLKNVDKVLVFNKWELIEEWWFNELININNWKFKELWELQINKI